VQYVRDFPVLWIKIDNVDPSRTIPLSTGSNLIVKDSRFSLRYDQASSTYTLQVYTIIFQPLPHYINFPCWFQIKDIQENDAGKYQCQVLLTVTEKISADVAVSVRIPPIIFDNSTRSVVVSEGEGVKLECYAGGYPAPTVS
jgi:neuronal growth regulator 1